MKFSFTLSSKHNNEDSVEDDFNSVVCQGDVTYVCEEVSSSKFNQSCNAKQRQNNQESLRPAWIGTRVRPLLTRSFVHLPGLKKRTESAEAHLMVEPTIPIKKESFANSHQTSARRLGNVSTEQRCLLTDLQDALVRPPSLQEKDCFSVSISSDNAVIIPFHGSSHSSTSDNLKNVKLCERDDEASKCSLDCKSSDKGNDDAFSIGPRSDVAVMAATVNDGFYKCNTETEVNADVRQKPSTREKYLRSHIEGVASLRGSLRSLWKMPFRRDCDEKNSTRFPNGHILTCLVQDDDYSWAFQSDEAVAALPDDKTLHYYTKASPLSDVAKMPSVYAGVYSYSNSGESSNSSGAPQSDVAVVSHHTVNPEFKILKTQLSEGKSDVPKRKVRRVFWTFVERVRQVCLKSA